jgi:hypothetical protein
MLAPVHLDRELGLAAGEIQDVGTDRKLAGEAGPVAGKEVPENPLLPRRLPPQPTGAVGENRVDAMRDHGSPITERNALRAYPPPAPPLQGGEIQ